MRTTVGPPFWSVDEDEEPTQIVDVLEMSAAAPRAAPDLDLEIADEPLPAAQIIGGMVAHPEYLRRIVVHARRERRRRLGAGHP